MNRKNWAQLIHEGKTRVNGEICCFSGCNHGFDYSELRKEMLVPQGWRLFVIPARELIGILCPTHVRQFPTESDMQRNLGAFDPEKMIDRPTHTIKACAD